MTTEQQVGLLPDLARRHASQRPDAPAVIDGSAAWSWSELDRRADGIAAAVQAMGVRPGDRVGVAIGGTAHGIAAIHGVPRSGASAVLIHPRLAAPEMAALLEAAGCRALVVDPALDGVVPPGLPMMRLNGIDTGAAAPEASPFGELILPTSGTTTRPKLARLPLDRIAASAASWIAFLPPASGWLLSLGLTHVAGIGIVARAAAAGVPIVIPAGLEPAALMAGLAGAGHDGTVVSHLSLVATQLAAILETTNDARPPDGVAAVILGGGPIPERLLDRAVAAGWPVIPSYGLTETASGIAALPADEVAGHLESVGRALPGVEIRIEDERIAVRGPMVFAGYMDDEAVATGSLTTDGWLRTGDLGRLDADGRLAVIGRIDDVIVTGGEKVSPADVEAVLAEHPAVAEVAVVGVSDPTWGRVPVAVVVLRPGIDPSDDDLPAHARARLARYKVPARFVRVAALPRNHLGKVIRADVARLAEAGDPDRPAEPNRGTVVTDDGQALAIREFAAPVDRPDAPTVVLLHATLSTSSQLLVLGRRLAEQARVVLVDRRGSGDSGMAEPGPVPVARHVADVIAVLNAIAGDRVTLVGHSFGGVVALETAAHHPVRVASVVAWEPPYLALAAPPDRAAMSSVADDVAIAFAAGGSEAAAHRFLDAVAGAGSWDRLHPRQRQGIGREGTGALADAAMEGLEPDGLDRVTCPVIIATGDASEPFYARIANALAARIGPMAVREHLPGLRHSAPITDPVPLADLVLRTAR